MEGEKIANATEVISETKAEPHSTTHQGDASPSESGSISKSNSEEKKAKNNDGAFRNYMRIFSFADRLDQVLFAVAIGGSIASGAALPLMTLVFGQFTTKFNDFTLGRSTPQQFRSDVDHFVLWFVYLFAAKFTIVYIANVCISIAALRTTRSLRQAFLTATLRQEVWHFDKEGSGSIASQVTTNGNRVNQGIADKLCSAIQGISLFFSAFIVALAVQWKLALITMSIVPAIFIAIGGCISVDAVIEARITKTYSQASVVVQDALSSIKTIHAFWAQRKIVKKYDEFLEAAQTVGMKKCPVYGVMFSTEYFCVLSANALAFWQGFRMYQSGEIDSAGTVLTVVLSVTIGATAMSIIAPQIQSITNATSAIGELLVTIDKPSLLDPLATTGEVPKECVGNVEVRGLSFAYPTRPSATVLHNVNLSIPSGKTTALVGASGCGKSTLVGLIERWYVPSSGSILLDGKDLSEYNTKWLRSTVRLVQQEPVLFRGTIFQNVANGFVGSQLELPYEEQLRLVKEACMSSNAHEFIEALPEGYETEVGERASMLSGGQRQRVAIARSIISNPKVLLLDEATSALDPRAERIVQDALDRVSVDKTTLIIAHKLATVKKADNIVVMAYGRVAEQGTHNQLIDLDGQYAALVRAQNLGGEKDREATFRDEEKDVTLDKTISLQRTKTDRTTEATSDDLEAQNLAAGTLHIRLIRCIYIMFREQTDLYWWFALATVGCLIGGGTFPAQALLYSRLINVFTLQGQQAKHDADFFALMFFVVALANLFGYFAVGWCCNVLAQTVMRRYRREMLERMIDFDQDFFDRPENSSGALTSKISALPQSLQELIAGNLLLIIIVLVNLFSSSALAIAYGWKLGLVIVFGGLPVLVGSGFVRIRIDQRLEAQTGEWFANSAGLATEAVLSIRTVSSLTMESQVLQEYAAMLKSISSNAIRSLFFAMIWYALSQSLEFLIMALGFWYGSRLIASGEYSTPQFFVIFTAVIFGGQAAGMFFGYTTSITKARSAANYILWLRTIKARIGENDENRDVGPSGDGDVGVDNVEFRYKQRDASRVLRGLDMKIKEGSYTACVGPSGCGKSTLISLLERFYDPTSGRITYNGKDIASMSPKLYRTTMSLVQQEPTLYQWTVRENITLGLQYDPSDEDVLEACRQANALEFISSLPESLSTPCGTKGIQFSGGQRQRIAIARALIRKPRLLLLDEATSALDTQSERVVQKTLDDAASTRTTIAVAHRLSTIRHADVIFVFANGRVAEMGTHEELQRQRGRYYEMCLAQSLDRS